MTPPPGSERTLSLLAVLAGLLAGGWLLYRLAPVLTPFMIAALLAYLGDPLVDRLQARNLPRTAAVAVVFLGMIVAGLSFLLLLIPVLQRQIVILAEKVPPALLWLQDAALPYLQRLPGFDSAAWSGDALRQAIGAHWQQLGGAVTDLLASATQSGQAIFSWLAYLLLIPVVTFYLMRDFDRLLQHLRMLIPRRIEPAVAALVGECDSVLAEFLRGQLLVMLCLAAIYALGLWVVGLDLAFLIGMLAGLVSFVPYLGLIVGALVAGFAALVQFGDVAHVLQVIAVFGVGQIVDGLILSPWLVGERIGLHPVAVIFAVMAGGQLFGFFGVLLALPAAAVLVVLLRHSQDRYLKSDFYTP
jgi:predicted PurR-regulated permease PerM